METIQEKEQTLLDRGFVIESIPMVQWPTCNGVAYEWITVSEAYERIKNVPDYFELKDIIDGSKH